MQLNKMVQCRLLRRRGCLVGGAVLAALVLAALVAVLVLRPWSREPPHARFPAAAVASNGFECASIGRCLRKRSAPSLQPREPILRFPTAAVGTNALECAMIGREILERNGSAVDAAIATLFCEGLGCAQCMGLGGGFLATVYDATTGRVRALNARERAPAATVQDMFNNKSSTVGGLAIAVPGELRGYGALHGAYGRLPWRELVRPAADLSRRGHRVTEYMGRVLKTYSDRIKAEPSMSEIYVNPATGEVWEVGDLVTNPALARTLDIIAEEGPQAMHNGSLTAALVNDIQGFGGIITEDDLRNYKVEWQEPIAVPLTGEHTLYSVPLPGSGSVLAFILNMLRGWVGKDTAVPSGADLYWHRIVETFKYAYAKRTGLGDPSRSSPSEDIPFDIRELERNLSSASWAASFRELVDDTRTYSDWQHYGALFEGADDHGTAQIVVVAPDGSAVSVTSTINYIWGSQRRSRSLGIMLNNEMDDFAIPNRMSAYGLPASPANMLAPNLQPLSSMTPSIVLTRNGSVAMVIGAAGGTKITTQVALATVHTIVEGQELPEVMQRPRLHHQLVPMEVEHEADFNPDVLASLQKRGHATTALSPTAGFAAMVGIQRDADGLFVPQTDRRRVGSIDGF